jgi:hypothetical protein
VVYSANIPPTGAVISESPFVRSLDVIAMMPDWSVMAAVTKGTNYIRDLSRNLPPARTPRRRRRLPNPRRPQRPQPLHQPPNRNRRRRHPAQTYPHRRRPLLAGTRQKHRRHRLQHQRIRPPRTGQQPDLRPQRHLGGLPRSNGSAKSCRRTRPRPPPVLRPHRRPPNLGLAQGILAPTATSCKSASTTTTSAL